MHICKSRYLPWNTRDRVLDEGDIVNIDVTLILDGWHGDTSRMYSAGNPLLKQEI
jgi:methionyl aminopeptidase